MFGGRDIWRWWCFCLALCCGCHSLSVAGLPSQSAATRAKRHVPVERVVVGHAAGAAVVTLVRPTPGYVRLALWIDAGSLDAAPPQLASVAAWIASARTGGRAVPVVYPNATELALDCEPGVIGECLRALNAALITRAPSAAELERALTTLQAARRRALAADAGRGGDTLALHALLGDAARGLSPLGDAQDDAAVSGKSLDAFVAAHYGPSRALFMATGDASPVAFESAVQDALNGAPQATATRGAQALAPSPDAGTGAGAPRLELAESDRDALSIALIADDAGSLRALISRVRDALHAEDSTWDASVTSHGLRARGAGLAVVRIGTRDLDTAISVVARELSQTVLEGDTNDMPSAAGTAATSALSGDDDVVSLSREFALRWAERESTAAIATRFALGMTLANNRPQTPRDVDAAASQLTRRSERLQSLFTQALVRAEPNLRGTIAEHAASVVTDNGVRIELQETAGDRAAISVRVALGAERDPPLLHGRSALLATLTASACAGLSRDELKAKLDALQASLHAHSDAESYGVVLELPGARVDEGMDLLLRCVRAPSRTAEALTDAITRSQARLGDQRSTLALRARVAALIAPAAPGTIAPWGDADTLGNVSRATLPPLFVELLQASRWSVSVLGPVAVRPTLQRVARRVAMLPTGKLGAPVVDPPPSAAAGSSVPLAQNSEGADVLLVFYLRDANPNAVAARVLSAALTTLLSRVPGVSTFWHDGDASAGGAYSALGLHFDNATLPDLPNLVASATTALDDATLDAALRAGLAAERIRVAADGSRIAVRTDRLARERLDVRPSDLTLEGAVRVVKALLQQKPLWTRLD